MYLFCYFLFSQGQEKIKQPWNTLASKQSKGDLSLSSTSLKTKSSQQPLTSHTFTKTWKYELTTSQERYGYLCKVGGQNLGQIFKSEIPMSFFGELMAVLFENLQSSDHEPVLDILQNLSNTNRFSLTVEFLSSKEKELVEAVFRKLQEISQDESQCQEGGNDRLKELAKIYKVDL